MIDKAIRKRFRLLCKPDSELMSEVAYFALRMYSYSEYDKPNVPKFRGKGDARQAFKKYLQNMIDVYAPRRHKSCGHFGRGEDCKRCGDKAIIDGQAFIDAWLIRKGITKDQWTVKVESWKIRNPEKAALNAPSEYILSILRQT